MQAVNSTQPYSLDNCHFVFGASALKRPRFLCVSKCTRTLEQNCVHVALQLGFACHSRLALHAKVLAARCSFHFMDVHWVIYWLLAMEGQEGMFLFFFFFAATKRCTFTALHVWATVSPARSPFGEREPSLALGRLGCSAAPSLPVSTFPQWLSTPRAEKLS